MLMESRQNRGFAWPQMPQMNLLAPGSASQATSFLPPAPAASPPGIAPGAGAPPGAQPGLGTAPMNLLPQAGAQQPGAPGLQGFMEMLRNAFGGGGAQMPVNNTRTAGPGMADSFQHAWGTSAYGTTPGVGMGAPALPPASRLAPMMMKGSGLF